MAQGDRYIGCLDPPVDWETLLSLLVLKDEDGNTHFNLNYNEIEECEDIEAAAECLIDMTFEEVLKLIIVEDECGRPAVNVIGVVCETCGLVEEQIL